MGDAANTGGTERAAILLLSLGEGEAAEVPKHMSAKDVQKVVAALASLSNVTREHAIAVIDRFVIELEAQTSLGVSACDYTRRERWREHLGTHILKSQTIACL